MKAILTPSDPIYSLIDLLKNEPSNVLVTKVENTIILADTKKDMKEALLKLSEMQSYDTTRGTGNN